MAKKVKSVEISEQTVTIQRLQRGLTTLHWLGRSPLVMNRMAAKAKQQLLLPPQRQNRRARELVLKHDPVAEFRDCVYRCRDDHAPTYLHAPEGAIKRALANSALDTPGATKAEVGRLVKIIDSTVHVYGRPYLFMRVVRNAGPSKTPDIRTRAIIPQWALKVTIQYIRTLIREQDIVNLGSNAGDIIGIGDGRTEKGYFDFGSWELVSADDPRWKAVVANGSRKVQLAAMQKWEAYDEETEELMAWYQQEIIQREQQGEQEKIEKAAKAAAKAEKAAHTDNGGRRRAPRI